MGQLSDELELVKIVLSFAGHLDLSVLLDLWNFWAELVVFPVGTTAF